MQVMENSAYQDKGRNHEDEKLPVVPFANTIVEPLENKKKFNKSLF